MEKEIIDDDSLYAGFLAGDNSSYERLMIRYGDDLILYLKGHLYSWEDAEDLMIRTFAQIMVKKPGIREGNFKSYLFKTAHNLIHHFYKKTRRRKVFSLEGLSELPGRRAETGNLSDLPGVTDTTDLSL